MLYKNPLFYKRLHLPYHSHLVVACSQMYLQEGIFPFSASVGVLAEATLTSSFAWLWGFCWKTVTVPPQRGQTVKEQSWSMVVGHQSLQVLRFSIANWLLGRGTPVWRPREEGKRAAHGEEGEGGRPREEGKGRPREEGEGGEATGRREKRGGHGRRRWRRRRGHGRGFSRLLIAIIISVLNVCLWKRLNSFT